MKTICLGYRRVSKFWLDFQHCPLDSLQTAMISIHSRIQSLTLDQGWTNAGHLVTRITVFCIVVPNNFSIITVVPPPLTYKNVYQITLTIQKCQITVSSQATPQVWVPQMELASCHPSGTQNLEVTPTFLENLWTSAFDLTSKNKNIMRLLLHNNVFCIFQQPQLQM